MAETKTTPRRSKMHESAPAKAFRLHWQLYLLLILPLAWVAIFRYWPMFGLQIAFRNFKISKGFWDSTWVGLKYFKQFLTDYSFKRLITNTLGISVYSLVAGFFPPIILAVALNECRHKYFTKTVQTVTYMPHFVSSVVVCGLMVIFCRSDGLLTSILTHFGMPKTNLLTIEGYFQPLYIGMNIWQELGWDSIIYFAALTSVDAALYEAARVDGAGRWRQMWHITLPGIAPTIVILLILRIGNLMSLGWDRIILMYNDMVMETADVISTYVYRTGLQQVQYSYATAVGLLNSIINVILLVSTNAISRKISDNSLW